MGPPQTDARGLMIALSGLIMRCSSDLTPDLLLLFAPVVNIESTQTAVPDILYLH
jgi:hypothetical protein